MTDEAAPGSADRASLKTLANRVNWVLDKAHTAGRGRLSDAEVVFKIHEMTGEKISTTTIWKLRNGQLTNPQLRVIEALAKTFGVPAVFLDDWDEGKSGPWREQVELLALIRTPGSPPPSSRPFSGWTTKAARWSPTSSAAPSRGGQDPDGGKDPDAGAS